MMVFVFHRLDNIFVTGENTDNISPFSTTFSTLATFNLSFANAFSLVCS